LSIEFFEARLVPSTADGFGDSFANATALSFDNGLSTSVMAKIQVSGNVDAFEVTTPVTGLLRIEAFSKSTPGLPFSNLVVFNNDHQHVADGRHLVLGSSDSNGSELTGLDIRVGIDQTYYVFLYPSSDYTFTVSAIPEDGIGSDFPNASPLILDKGASATKMGIIDKPDKADVFQFVAPFTALLQIGVDVDRDSAFFHPDLAVYDSSRNAIIPAQVYAPRFQIPQGDFAPDSEQAISVVAGETYYVRISSVPGASFLNAPERIGEYKLTISAIPDDGFGHTFPTATHVQFDNQVRVSLTGNITSLVGVDVFQLIAPFTGTIEVNANPVFSESPGPILDPGLTVFDSSQRQIAFDGSFLADGARLQVNVSAGQVYYVSITSFSSEFSLQDSIGKYNLTMTSISADDNGHMPSTATELQSAVPGFDSGFFVFQHLGSLGSGNGKILPEGVDYFRFVAPFSGILELRASPSFTLDTMFTLYDGSLQQIAQLEVPHSPFAFPFDTSSVTFTVKAGQKYYVSVSASQNASPNNQFGGFMFEVDTPLSFTVPTVSQPSPIIVPQGASQPQFPITAQILTTQQIDSLGVTLHTSSGSSTSQVPAGAQASGSSGLATSELLTIGLPLRPSADIELRELLSFNATNFAFGLETLMTGTQEQVAELLPQKESSLVPVATLMPRGSRGRTDSSTGGSAESGDRTPLNPFLISFDPASSNEHQTGSRPLKPSQASKRVLGNKPEHEQRMNGSPVIFGGDSSQIPSKLLDLLFPKPADQRNESPGGGKGPEPLSIGGTQSSADLEDRTELAAQLAAVLCAVADRTELAAQLAAVLCAVAASEALCSAGALGPEQSLGGRPKVLAGDNEARRN
jgi:hypothetical protein